MARRRTAATDRRDGVSAVRSDYRRVWQLPKDPEVTHPFGPGAAYESFREWCAAREALVDELESHDLTILDFEGGGE